MFPFLFFGLGLGTWLDSILKPKSANMTNNNVKMVTSFNESDEMYKFIAMYEGFRSSPYKLAGESLYTIGIGSTSIFSKDGLHSRKVLVTDRMTLDEAIFNCKIYFHRKESFKNQVDAIIKKYGFDLNQRFYDMLMQITYGSGSFHRNKNFYSRYIEMLQRANNSNDTNMLAELLKDSWIAYLKAYANYTLYGTNWSQRACGIMQYIKGLPYDKATTQKIMKGKRY